MASVNTCTVEQMEGIAGEASDSCPFSEGAAKQGVMKDASISAAKSERAANHAWLVVGSAYNGSTSHIAHGFAATLDMMLF